jgi:hypothetical protein
MTTLDKIAGKIVKEQELVIGPLAWTEAQKVQGIHVLDQSRGEVELTNGDPKQVVDRLVGQYERLFGRASIEVCREAAQGLISNLAPSEVPSSLLAA